jgi:hypothetical protein
MSRLLPAILAILLFSCKNVNETKFIQGRLPNTKELTLSLADSLGLVYLTVPGQYDTAVSWVHFGDCGQRCNYQKYRYQPKALPLQKENGFYWLDTAGVIDRLTIQHRQQLVDEYDGNREYFYLSAVSLGEEEAFGVSVDDTVELHLVLDTLQMINNRPFAIVAYEGFNPDSKRYSGFLLAVTPMKQGYLRFMFRRKNKQAAGSNQEFIRGVKHMVERVRIESVI